MKTTATQTQIKCRHNTAGMIFILIGCLFCFVGCAQIYRAIGMSEEQITSLVAKDQEALQKILNAGRLQVYDIIMTVIAGTGTILSGILAKWLGTERKITAAMIKAVEETPEQDIKSRIQAKATAAGVEDVLHTRVVALT